MSCRATSAPVILEAVPPRALGVLLLIGLALMPRLVEARHDFPYRPSEGVIQDLLDVGKLAGSGFLLQFAGIESLALMGLTAIGASGLGREMDDPVQRWFTTEQADGTFKDTEKRLSNTVTDALAFAGEVMAIPWWEVALYGVGRTRNDHRLVAFAKDAFATHLIVGAEVQLLKGVFPRTRPDGTEPSSAARRFLVDGESSFPSRHAMGLWVLGFKAWDHDYEAAAVAGFVLGTGVSVARVAQARHFATDVLTTFLLSWIASQGTERARRTILLPVASARPAREGGSLFGLLLTGSW